MSQYICLLVCWYANPSNPITSSCHVLLFFPLPFDWHVSLVTLRRRRLRLLGLCVSGIGVSGVGAVLGFVGHQGMECWPWSHRLRSHVFVQSNGWLVFWERFLGWGFVWRSWDVGFNDWIISVWRKEKIPMQLMLAKEVEQHNYRCAVRKAMCKTTTNVFCPLLVEQMFGL